MIYAENILICVAVPFLISLLFVRGPVRRFTAFFLLGMAVCLLAAYIDGYIAAVGDLGENDTAVFISPMIEELMKFLPLLLYLYVFRPEGEQLSLAAVGIGVGFALFENSCYILTSGAGSLPYILIRGMAVGVMHIVSMLVLAFGLIVAIRLRAVSFSGIVGALALAMTYHGIYNLLVSEPGVTSLIGYALPLVTAILLYHLYRKYRPE